MPTHSISYLVHTKYNSCILNKFSEPTICCTCAWLQHWGLNSGAWGYLFPPSPHVTTSVCWRGQFCSPAPTCSGRLFCSQPAIPAKKQLAAGWVHLLRWSARKLVGFWRECGLDQWNYWLWNCWVTTHWWGINHRLWTTRLSNSPKATTHVKNVQRFSMYWWEISTPKDQLEAFQKEGDNT